ncbi:hypothetical protein SAMN05444371_2470 [Epilithonimonas mollis]|uniref:Uncharacterized protein n=1 Tax=Epilithonimonas mollis TaxID=216903 RepID=A0A1M6SHR0_9FLAO|nr:hypothetical protein SAMN05444371_2470 [Epilithonimonas mollis]
MIKPRRGKLLIEIDQVVNLSSVGADLDITKTDRSYGTSVKRTNKIY